MARLKTIANGMPWSKLRSTLRAFICPELRSRIDFHVTSYCHSHDEAEKVWITIDGKRALTASWYRHQWRTNKRKDEDHLPQELGDALRAYLDLSISAAQQSTNPFIRALSIVDRRTGRRIFEAMRISEEDHSLIKAFHALRFGALKRDKQGHESQE